MQTTELRAFLSNNKIDAPIIEHAPVFTVDEAAKLPPIPGLPTKNLFLRDKKGKRHFLVVAPDDEGIDLRQLEGVFGSDRLSFGSPERLRQHLGIEPGSVSVLALVNDSERKVELAIVKRVLEAKEFHAHPLVNTATTSITPQQLQHFLDLLGRRIDYLI